MGKRVALVSPEGLYKEAIELGHVAVRCQANGDHVAALVAEQEAAKHIVATKGLAARLGHVGPVVVRAHPHGRRKGEVIRLGHFEVAINHTLIDELHEQDREALLLSTD